MKRFNGILSLFCLTILQLNSSCNSSKQINISNENIVANIASNTANEISKTVEPSLIINNDGWELPDFTKLKLTEKRVKQKINSPKPVYVNQYSPKNEDVLLNTSLGRMRVLAVREFEIENRKFCYGIAITNPLGPRAAGVVINLTYYDLDGDGKFETKDMKGGGYIPTIFPN